MSEDRSLFRALAEKAEAILKAMHDEALTSDEAWALWQAERARVKVEHGVRPD